MPLDTIEGAPNPVPHMPPQQRCQLALDLLVTHRGDPSLQVEQALADDQGSVLGHYLRAALIVLADDHAACAALNVSLAALNTTSPADMHARRHALAAEAWLQDDSELAAERYGEIVAVDPRDILALVVAHALDFRLGHRRLLRDRIAQVLPYWDASMPGYASVLAMYAFGLEENGEYARAEAIARQALQLDPRLASAIHVISHVMEMQGRTREGLAFLTATEAAWSQGTGFSVHLAWHKALFHLDAVDPRSALTVYDEQIAHPGASEMSVLADASALLWRLQLRNVEVDRRWQALSDRWESHSLAGVRPFYVVHAMMAFAATGRAASAARALEALPRRGAGDPSKPPEEELGVPFCTGLLAYARGDYAACVDWLSRVRHIAHRCGGSLAQCDLIHLTFTEAAIRAREARLARALVAERSAQKPASLLNRLLQERLQTMPAAA